MTGQLSLDPIRPKEGTLKAAVLELLFTYRDGICRDVAREELHCYELAARIIELKALGWDVRTRRCERHNHRQRFIEYHLA